MKRTLLTIVAFLGVTFSSLQADDYLRNPNINILHYVFRLSLSDATDEIVGETTIDYCWFKFET